MTLQTATATATEPATFLLAYQNSMGQWKRVGFIKRGKRLQPDAEVKAFFGTVSKNYTSILKSCRFLDGDSAAQWVDWHSYRGSTPILQMRTIKLSSRDS